MKHSHLARLLPPSLLLPAFLLLTGSGTAFAAAPVTGDDLLLVAEGGSVRADYLLANDSDADGDALSLTAVTQPTNGLVVNHGDGSLSYTPDAGFTGDDGFTYELSDGQSTATGSVRVSVNASYDAEAARDALLAGVSSLVDPTQPGHMVAWGPTAQVISSYPGADERDPMIVASSMGAGRLLALPDHQWLNMDSYGSDPSMGAFYQNGLNWVSRKSDRSIKIVTFNAGSATWLGAQGYDNVVVADASSLAGELADADALVAWLGNGASQATIDAVRVFVKTGGGLLLCDYGIGYDWWWGKASPDIPGNRALREAGVGFTKSWPHGGAQSIERATDQVTDDHLVAVLEDPGAFSKAVKSRAAEVFNRVNDVLSETDTLQARLDAVFWTQVSGLTPTPSNPVSDPLEKALLNREGQILRGLPVSEVRPHRAALPVDPGAPRVDASLSLEEPAAGHAHRLLDTGLYAAPGERVEIVVPEALVGIGLQVQIGHLRTDTGDANYYTMPYQQFFFEVDATTRSVASPHGGLLMFVAPSGTEWIGAQPVQVKGAVAAPYFVFGRHDNADWIAEARDRGTPFGVLRSPSTVLVVESEAWLRDLSDPHELMSVYDPLIREIDNFYDYHTGRELRIHHDYQPAGGVSAFPLSYSVDKSMTDAHSLRVHGEPLTMHEHGHHADNSKIIFHEFGETSPNLGGKYAQQVLSNFSWKQELAVGRINNYLLTQTDDLWDHFNHYRVDVKTTPFDSIAEVFGWETLKDIVHAISALPAEQADTSQEKLDQWLVQTGNQTGHDVSAFLERWQLSFSPEAKSAVAELPPWDMIEIVGEDLVVEQDGSATIGDPTVNDFSYDGTLVFGGYSAPAHGRLEDHGNDTWTYTPSPGFNGEDALRYTLSNGSGNVYTGSLAIRVTPRASFPSMEAGKARAGTLAWTLVELARSYESPVVVAQPVLEPGGPPLVSRLRKVSGGSFELLLQRADGQPGTIEDVQVQYLVVEEGVYEQDVHGIKMEALRLDAPTTDHAGSFVGRPVALAHDDWDHYFIPVLLGQVMTFNDPRWSTFWASGGPAGYQMGKHVGEDPDTDRDEESLGYVVMEAGSLQVGGLRFQAGSLGHDGYAGFDRVSAGGAGHNFERMPALSGALVQAQGSGSSEEGYWTVLDTPLASGNRVSARLVEDQLLDAEQSHDSLGGSYLLFADFAGGVTAIDDAVLAVQDAPSLVRALANDRSTLGLPLRLDGFGQPAHGEVADNGDGTLTYTPEPGFTGRDRFAYQVAGGGAVDSGRVSVEVRPVTAAETGLRLETWLDIAGSDVSNLLANPRFPKEPDERVLLTEFEAPADRGSDFGARAQGLLFPPVSGDYRFWIASDDDSQLWLGTDARASSRRQIASIDGWTGPREWDASAGQQSEAIPLQAGQAYYVEALHKEGGGADHLAVAWEGPGMAQRIIDGAFLQTPGRSAPLVVGPIADQVVAQDASDSVLDATGVFTDTDPGDSLSLEIHANSLPQLVTASLAEGRLRLSYAPGGFGRAEIALRAVDREGSMAVDAFTVEVTRTAGAPVYIPYVANGAITGRGSAATNSSRRAGPVSLVGHHEPGSEAAVTR